MFLKHDPTFVSLAVEGFYDGDIDSMKDAAKMKRFLPKGKEKEMAKVVVVGNLLNMCSGK